ncbi:MAG: hypothetical protein ABSE35_25055, partial [Bryobacteraceae bacterium]
MAHALLRAASRLFSTRLRLTSPGVGKECRRGTHECVCHVKRGFALLVGWRLFSGRFRMDGKIPNLNVHLVDRVLDYR